jgi:hypothetical protein
MSKTAPKPALKRPAPSSSSSSASDEPAAKKAKPEPPISLDDTEPAKSTVDSIKWTVIEPEEWCDVWIIQEGLDHGVRCAQIDIHRLKSQFFTVLLEQALKEKTNGGIELGLPKGLFESGKELGEFLTFFFKLNWNVNLSNTKLVHWLHCSNALDLLQTSTGIQLMKAFDKISNTLPALQQIELGKRYHKPDLVKSGALALGASVNVDLKQVSDALLRECAPVWTKYVREAVETRKSMQAFLATRRFNAHGHSVTSFQYAGDQDATVESIRRSLGLTLDGK